MPYHRQLIIGRRRCSQLTDLQLAKVPTGDTGESRAGRTCVRDKGSQHLGATDWNPFGHHELDEEIKTGVHLGRPLHGGSAASRVLQQIHSPSSSLCHELGI